MTSLRPTHTYSLLDKQARLTRDLDRFRAAHPPPAHGLPRSVAEVLAHIHQHLFDPQLNASTARARCRLNHNFSARFRCAVGLGMRDYIETLRLRAASLLLRRSDIEIYLIGTAIGYSHQETFCRAFLRHFEHTPSVHRERARGQRPASSEARPSAVQSMAA